MDLAGYVTSWNKGAEKLFGYTADEAVGQHILFIYAGEDEEEDVPFNTFLEERSREFTVRRRKKSGEVFWASITLSLTRGADGVPNGMVGYLVDITERLETETQLRLHARIFERSTEAVIVTDSNFKTISVNKAFTDITGYLPEDVMGETPSVLKPCSFESNLMVELRTALEQVGNWQGELWDWRKSEDIFPTWVSINAVRNDKNKLTNYFIVMSDITERKEAEQQIYRLAYYDALTSLPNRALLYSLVEQALAEAHRTHGHGALLILDINRFKHLNDSFGHSAADKLLQEIAQRLSTTLRSEDVVARMGGDEFVIALFDIAQRDHAGLVAQKILDVLSTPFHVEHFELIVTTSIGIAVYPEDGRDCETLIRCADVAMYRAKQQSNHGYVFYSHDMNLRSIERLKLETGLRRGLERNELRLFYQPQIDLQSGRLIGAEALIRWFHPEHGIIPPGQFIPIAEETGLILPIGEWVIAEACRQIGAWRAAGMPLVRIAVNISSRQFRPDLPAKVFDILKRFDTDPALLELELTESMLMHNAEDVIAMMQQLSDGGLSLSLDDFGTGFSSLAYLTRFPIDKLKIDQSFVRGIPEGAKDIAIARTIISLAQNLELKVLAEGVETEAQADFLCHAGCDQMQGYLFSKPIPAEDFGKMLVKLLRD
jgi:diguanylate cyclase (GGDEF)-like protein/PAS domain S-box-containing protein